MKVYRDSIWSPYYSFWALRWQCFSLESLYTHCLLLLISVKLASKDNFKDEFSMSKQGDTPLLDALNKYRKEEPISFHVPGHKNGHIFSDKGIDTYQSLLQIDTTELEGLDDLHAPEGPILQAQQLLSSLYNTQKSYFLINGSTCGNLSMIMGTCSEDDIVLVQKNCHKSVLHALRLAKARPIFLHTMINNEWKTAEGLDPVIVHRALKQYKNIKALILTYPSYYGVGSNIEKIITLAHKFGVKVLVDEAHGAHFIGEPFLKSSLSYGADIVVQSAHKTLPAMTMGAYLHINKEVMDYKSVEQYLRIFQSSSPSYPIMASLDLARFFLATLTKADLQYTKEKILYFREQLSFIEGIKVLGHNEKTFDILKLTIQTNGTFSGYEFQSELKKYGIYSELADPHNILLVLPILKVGQKFPYMQAVNIIKEVASYLQRESKLANVDVYMEDTKSITELEISFAEMATRNKVQVTLNNSIGNIAAEMITPYPPGVPFLMDGEIITRKKVEYLKYMIGLGVKFHGGDLLKKDSILVYE